MSDDNMWSFLEHQKSNPKALEDAVHTLIGYAKGKNFSGAANKRLDSLEMIKFTIICEAAALVLSDEWQAFRRGNICSWEGGGEVEEGKQA